MVSGQLRKLPTLCGIVMDHQCWRGVHIHSCSYCGQMRGPAPPPPPPTPSVHVLHILVAMLFIRSCLVVLCSSFVLTLIVAIITQIHYQYVYMNWLCYFAHVLSHTLMSC